MSEYGRYSSRDYALIEGIHLLGNMMELIEKDLVILQTVFSDWQLHSTLSLENQVSLIFGTSADDKASRYLVYCINRLNAHKMYKYKHRGYLIMLTKDCLAAITRAIRAHTHIWNNIQSEALKAAFSSSHIIKSKGLPYYEPEDDEDEDEDEAYVLEYKGD
ncbi:hypothetical protein LCGC14_0963280 [marine sediment metagenome]|uniref:Uncharacterized protein n=1 Tax=marine sediment metagenome TaxID=412755 RepID=A0A0F9NDX2_9ZZZZ